jgi:malate synthase
MVTRLPAGVKIVAPVIAARVEILSPEVPAFVVRLHRRFNARRKKILVARMTRQAHVRS